jgi:hypothetical protein
MRRNAIRTGDLLGWSEFRDGPSRPGIALGPMPIHSHYGGKYSKAQTPSAKHLVLAPHQFSGGQLAARQLNELVEKGEYAVPSDTLAYVKATRARLEAGETVDDGGAPKFWGWHLVPSSMLRGPYPELHAADIRGARARQETVDEEDARAAAHQSALFRTLKRMDERDLDRRRVAFHREHRVGGEKDPLVMIPLSVLAILLNDGER